jgi:hypothetical protein
LSALIAAETLVLVLLSLLVAGLLRSHAEILRRLAELDGGDDRPAPESSRGNRVRVGEGLPPARSAATPAFDLAGTTLEGDAVKLAVATGDRPTLLAFLSTGCLSCRTFWDDLRGNDGPALPGGGRVVVVTKDPAFESPTKLREIAPTDVPVVMSSAAWDWYGVQGSPYFIHVAGGVVHGEGTAGGWDQVLSLLRDARDDERHAARRASGPARQRRAEEELLAAGIGPGHPSLYGGAAARGRQGESDG